eukprot:435472_1
MVIIFAIGLWFVVKSDDTTCCYGKYCPLPIFNQFTANWTYLQNQAVMSNSACCPSGGSAVVNSRSDITSSCICSKRQTCPSIFSNEADAVACTYYYQNTRCPDSNFNGKNFNFSTGEIILNNAQYCVYTPDGASSRGMSQRCPIKTICNTKYYYGGGVVNGTYYYSRLYNGFAAYKHEAYESYIAVIADWTCHDCNARWSLTIGKPWGGRSFMTLPDPIYYSDATSIEGIESGFCPTPKPSTSTEIPIVNTTVVESSISESSSNIATLVVIGVIAVVLCGVVLAVYLWWKNRKTKQQKNDLQYNLIQ